MFFCFFQLHNKRVKWESLLHSLHKCACLQIRCIKSTEAATDLHRSWIKHWGIDAVVAMQDKTAVAPPLWGSTGAPALQIDTTGGLPSRSCRKTALTSNFSNCERHAISGLQTHCNTEGINPTGFICPHRALHYKCLYACVVLQSKTNKSGFELDRCSIRDIGQRLSL